MDSTVREWGAETAHIRARMKLHDAALYATQNDVVNQALALRDKFRKEREEMRLVALAEIKAATPIGHKPKPLYAALNLFARLRNGGLEIFWQEVHTFKTAEKPVYKYLSRNGKGGYNLQVLLSRARPFERELVEKIERRAQELRIIWRELVKMRGSGRVLVLSLNAASTTKPGRTTTQPIVATTPVAPHIIELVPSMA
jgi:hypothetical protein